MAATSSRGAHLVQVGSAPRRSPLVLLGGTVAVALLSGWLYEVGVHAASYLANSDGATVVLQGRSMANGNLLLAGWNLSLDSFWTLDTPFYAVATGIFGIHPALLIAVPAVVLALLVAAGAALARRGVTGPAGAAGMVTAVVALALPSRALASLLLANPIHQTTTLFALAAFLGLRRNRWGVGWLVAVVLLAAGMLGDLQMVSYATVPVAVAGLVATLRRRSLTAGLVPISAAAVAAVAAVGVRKIAVHIGSFTVGPTNPHATHHQMLHNLRTLPSALAELFGVVNNDYGRGGVPAWLLAFHVVVAAVVVIGFVAAAWLLLRGVVRGTPGADEPAAGPEPEAWRLDDLLLIAAFGPALDYVYLSLVTEVAYVRYLTATAVFASVLAARMVTRWWADGGRPGWHRPAAAVAAVVAALLVAANVVAIGQPAAPEVASQLVPWLEAHHLTDGVGDYWTAAMTTVESSGTIRVRPVQEAPSGKLAGFSKGETAEWFDHRDFTFVAYMLPAGYDNVDTATATATWGRPAHRYTVDGTFAVLVWTRPHRIRERTPN